MKLRFLSILVVLPVFLHAQQINYSEPESDDNRRTNFEIIGKISGNILVFKDNRNDAAISVYNMDMKLLDRVKLDFLPEKSINVDFVQYPEFCYMIYEYQRKNTVHCSVVKLNSMGRRISEPVDLDTTQINFAANNKIYTNIVSEDKQRIMVVKVNSKNPKDYVFTTFLFDNQLNLIDRHRLNISMEERSDMFTDFALDNGGQLVFAKFSRSGTNEYISKVALISKAPLSDTFSIKNIGANDRVLDELKVKIDNNNKRYIVAAFYYKQRRGNIEGLYTVVWDKTTDTKLKETVSVFNEELRGIAKSSEDNTKMAFNDYFIKNIVVKKDGGYLVVSEAEYSTSRGSVFNRWDYMYGYSPFMSPMDYYSPFYNPYSPYSRYGTGNAARYNAENILVVSFDQSSNIEWSNVIQKTQFDDDGSSLISFHMVNTGGALHFLYNQNERRTILLADQSITPDGKLTRYPTLKNLDKGYDFMARYGKQISSNQIIIPCLYRNYLCFANIEF